MPHSLKKGVLFNAPRLSLPPRPHLSLMGAAYTCQNNPTHPTLPELQVRHKDTCWKHHLCVQGFPTTHTPLAAMCKRHTCHTLLHFTARKYFCKAATILGYIKSLALTHRFQVITTEHEILSQKHTTMQVKNTDRALVSVLPGLLAGINLLDI